jgi:hypothetical protein
VDRCLLRQPDFVSNPKYRRLEHDYWFHIYRSGILTRN